MADKIQSFILTCPTGTTTTTLTFVDKYDQLQVYIPNVVGSQSSSTVNVSLKGAPSATDTPKQLFFYDYINKTPASCVITISTGGVYEIPYPGAIQFLQVQFDVAMSNVTNIKLMTPKTTY